MTYLINFVKLLAIIAFYFFVCLFVCFTFSIVTQLFWNLGNSLLSASSLPLLVSCYILWHGIAPSR